MAEHNCEILPPASTVAAGVGFSRRQLHGTVCAGLVRCCLWLLSLRLPNHRHWVLETKDPVGHLTHAEDLQPCHIAQKRLWKCSTSLFGMVCILLCRKGRSDGFLHSRSILVRGAVSEAVGLGMCVLPICFRGQEASICLQVLPIAVS